MARDGGVQFLHDDLVSRGSRTSWWQEGRRLASRRASSERNCCRCAPSVACIGKRCHSPVRQRHINHYCTSVRCYGSLNVTQFRTVSQKSAAAMPIFARPMPLPQRPCLPSRDCKPASSHLHRMTPSSGVKPEPTSIEVLIRVARKLLGADQVDLLQMGFCHRPVSSTGAPAHQIVIGADRC